MKKRALALLALAFVTTQALAGNFAWNSSYQGSAPTADDIETSTTNFGTNLSSADNTVQKALDTLDDLVASGGVSDGDKGDITVSSSGTVWTIDANSVALTTDTTGNYAAGDAEAGAALTGDSATAFFAAGQIETARGGTGADLSGSTGTVIVAAGTVSANTETGTGDSVRGTSPTFTTSAIFGATGVSITDDGDGAITFLGLSTGADEDLTLNLDDTSNKAVFSTSTGVVDVAYTDIDLLLTESNSGNESRLFIDSEGSATVYIDRGGSTAGRAAVVQFQTAGTKQFAAGVIGSTDRYTFQDEGANTMGYIEDGGSVGNWTITGTLSAAATTVTTLDTGQGANELYDMDQNVLQASDVTFNTATVATEVYDGTGWNGDNSVPTKDAVRDKLETFTVSGWTDNGSTVNSTAATDNFVIGSTSGTAGTSATATLGIVAGTAPSTSPTDTVQLYGAAGTDYTKLMLHFDEADGSTTPDDASASNHTLTAVGGVHVETDQFKYGTASSAHDGSGDYWTIPDHADFHFSTNDFTLETWVRYATVGTSTFYSQNTNGSNYTVFYYDGSSWRILRNGAELMTAADSPTTNTWYHYAFANAAGSNRIFRDGTQKGTTTSNSTAWNNHTSLVRLGSDITAVGGDMNGYMDDFRILNGLAKYTANFTAPTAALPNATDGVELKVRDEDGNTTTLSPHNVEGLGSARLAEIKQAGHVPVTIHHTSPEGVEEWIDLAGMAMELEALSGKKIIFQKEEPPLKVDQRAQISAAIENDDTRADASTMDDKELRRRWGWIREKVRREVAFQDAREAEGQPLTKSELPPKWIQDLVDKAKEGDPLD